MKRNTLTTAVVAGLTGMAGMVSVSNAVNVNPDGMGQVLLYPYYSARGGNDTLISIVNTTERGKAVKIRFREAINSRDVLDFHIYMSAYDVWTAAVTANDAGGAKLVTKDTTCTVPYIYGEAYDGEVDFLPTEFNTIADKATGIENRLDNGPTGEERVASGYIEVIEMGVLDAAPSKAPKLTGDSKDPDGYVAWAVEHSKGVPGNCDALVNAWTANAGSTDTLGGAWLSSAMVTGEDGDPTVGFDESGKAPTGGLFGSASIINVAEGTMFSYNATAIEGFFAPTSIDHEQPGFENPSLATRGTTEESNIFENGSVGTYDWSGNGDDAAFNAMLALNSVLTNDKLMNEYVTDASIGAETEWVVTMPTKRFHVDANPTDEGGAGVTAGSPKAPFTRTTAYNKTAASQTFACEDVSFSFWDREEQQVSESATAVPPVVSPMPQIPSEKPDLFQLCREANVIRFASDDSYPDASGILKEPKRADTVFGYNNFELAYSEGWMQLDLADVPEDSEINDTVDIRRSLPATIDGGDSKEFTGLPVVGFAVTTYTNGNVGEGVLSNYGGTFQHRTSRTIVSSGQ